MHEIKDLIPYDQSPPTTYKVEDKNGNREQIRVYRRKKRYGMIKAITSVWKFSALCVAFAAIFFLTYCLFFDKGSDNGAVSSDLEETDSLAIEIDTSNCDVEVFSPTVVPPPILIDEAKSDINIEEYFYDTKNICDVLKTGKIKVLVIHSHSSEMVSESINVIDAGSAIVQILCSYGIDAIHCVDKHDEYGRIGAYKRMKDSIGKFKNEYPELAIVIDLHSAEIEAPILFNIGVSHDYAWKENLRIISAIYHNMSREDCVFRLLPQNLGQDNGIITINVGIGYENADDAVARELVASLALGIISLFAESTPE